MSKYYYYVTEFICDIRKINENGAFGYDYGRKSWYPSGYTKERIEEKGIEIPEHLALLWIMYE